MRRVICLIAALTAILPATIGAAHAKGLMGSGTINGPGTGSGINLRADEDTDGDGFWTLLAETGVSGAVEEGRAYEIAEAPPSDEIGPRYTLNWELEQFEGPDVNFVQYVYPYAANESWIFTPRSVTIMGTAIPAGWHSTGSNALRFHLERNGLPQTNPVGSTAAKSSQTAAEAESSSNSYVPIAIIAALIALIVVASNRRVPRAAKAS